VKPFALFVALCCLPFAAWAEDYTLRLHYTKAPARDVLRVYEKLSTHPVFMALDLDALVTIESEKEIPAAEALELIRKTLLERYGIELRKTERGETVAGWSKDPKYPRHSDAPPVDETGAKGRPR
jgi:hypothetical protein